MRRITTLVLAGAGLCIAAAAYATTPPNSAVIHERVFDNCPTSVLTVNNSFPALITIDDQNVVPPFCAGFANLHTWRFSTDATNDQQFLNEDTFEFACEMVLNGVGEGGLNLSPWWGPQADGLMNVRTTDGEIACFGGRLPFYSFTVNHALSYVKGTPIYLELTYLSHSLTQADPATIQYRVTYNAVTYDSPVLNYDEGNPNEDPPHGLWGCLHDAMVGGYFQPRANTGVGLTGIFNSICYENLDVVPVQNSTWGRLKTIYR
jgi:hypothetical protein